MLARLRSGDPPVVARVERGQVVLDLRTVPSEQDLLVAAALTEALGSRQGPGGEPGPGDPPPDWTGSAAGDRPGPSSS